MRPSFVIAGLAAAVLATAAVMVLRPSLETLQADLVADYPDVSHIDPDALLRLDAGTLHLIDVREINEFAVSHIAGAGRVDPNVSAVEFVARYGETLAGSTIVFYCSVGRRASHLAQRLRPSLDEAGVRHTYNLIGGVFRWHNEGRALVDSDGRPTRSVHGASIYWRGLVGNGPVVSAGSAVASMAE